MRPSIAPGEILHDSQAGLMGQQGNLMFISATGVATSGVLDDATNIHRSLAQRYPHGYVYLLNTRADAPMPSAEARDRFAKMDKEFGPYLLASAMVIEGDGLLATTMRMVMRSMSIAFSKTYPMKYFASAPEALAWLETQCGSEKHFRTERVLELMGRTPALEIKVA